MSGSIRLASTLLAGTGKEGKLAQDEHGYVWVSLGALNAFNRTNDYYTAEGVLELFHTSTELSRRIREGALWSEYGHPKFMPGMSEAEYFRRAISIYEDNICAHIAEIDIDLEFGRKNPDKGNSNMILISGRAAPKGAKGFVFQEAIDNPEQNCAFSVRCLNKKPYMNARGYREKMITKIITWDFVNDPGIQVANKHTSLSLESSANTELLIDVDMAKGVLDQYLNSVSLESNEHAFYEEIKEAISKTDRKRERNARIFTWS